MNFFFSVSIFFFFMTFANGQKLQQGDIAPNFKVKNIEGQSIRLRKELKESRVLLVFLRHAWCPVCNVRTHELKAAHEDLKQKGIKVIVVYLSSAQKMKAYKADYDLPFEILTDYELYKTYGLEFNGKKIRKDFASNSTTITIKKKGRKLFGKYKSKKYKDSKEIGKDLIPGDILINQDGSIERAYYGQFFGDHLPLSDLL